MLGELVQEFGSAKRLVIIEFVSPFEILDSSDVGIPESVSEDMLEMHCVSKTGLYGVTAVFQLSLVDNIQFGANYLLHLQKNLSPELNMVMGKSLGAKSFEDSIEKIRSHEVRVLIETTVQVYCISRIIRLNGSLLEIICSDYEDDLPRKCWLRKEDIQSISFKFNLDIGDYSFNNQW